MDQGDLVRFFGRICYYWRMILLLEDDLILGETLEEDLRDEGYNVMWVKNATEALDATYEQRFELYLFDVNVPGQSGFSLLSELREAGDATPALFLTARSGIKDLQAGFSAGADDYVTKPFNMDELLIRIKAKMRTSQRIAIAKGCHLDMDGHRLVCGEAFINLPNRELQILHYFLLNKTSVISKDEIFNELFEGDYISDATFRVYIKNLNAHLRPFAILNNVRGVGYRFEIL